MFSWRARCGLVLGAVVIWVFAVGVPVASAATPVVSSFSPTAGTIGTKVTINGSGFTGTSAVKFGGGQASFTVVSASKISATVPASAATGKISVTTPGGTGSSSGSFTVQPSIALSTTTGPPTTMVTVSGAGFGAFEAIDIYFDSTEEAVASANSTGNFSGPKFQVPASATPGDHQITAIGRHSGDSGQATFTVATSWPEFRYSAKHRGSNPYENVLSAANVTSIDEDWSFATGGIIDSSPAVANGVVYVGSEDGNVYALNASTGAKLWSFATGGGVFSTPAVANGVVYVGSKDGNVYALNASTGAKLWSFTTGAAVDSSPAVANGVVYVGSNDENVYALKASTGAKLWSFATGGAVFSSPAVANGALYVGSTDDNVYALNASTGAKLWSSATGGPVFSSPAVANGLVWVGSDDDNLYTLNASTGAEVAPPFTASAPIDSSPALANGWVYFGSADGNLYAQQFVSPENSWQAGPLGGQVFSSPAVANGVLYFGSYNSVVYAVNATSNSPTLLWRFFTGGIVGSSPAVANGVVYVGSGDGSLYAFDLAGGMASTVAANWHLNASSTAVGKLTVHSVPRGGSVSVTCSGAGCPFTRRNVSSRERAASLTRLFKAAACGRERASRSRLRRPTSPARRSPTRSGAGPRRPSSSAASRRGDTRGGDAHERPFPGPSDRGPTREIGSGPAARIDRPMLPSANASTMLKWK